MPATSLERTQRNPRHHAIENRLVTVTRDRLRRVFESLLPRQQEVLHLVPLLFHQNYPLLPGYAGQETPAGVADYNPTRTALAAARRHAKTFHYEPRAPRWFALRGLYLMGSAGTIAYSRDSDLDIWVCHDPDLKPEEVDKLQAKASLIEAFALTQGLEMHFFVFNAERFKRGETLGLSDESSGSSQHYLLLDEFYRSGLLLAGLKPLWWFVPPADEGRYDEFVTMAARQRRIALRSYVDFGGLPTVPPAEFFGAAVWQLYKSIESPYKSVMKLLLMETYAAEYPNSLLLSHRYKSALTTDKVTLDDLDPYIAMYRKVEEYLLARNDTERLRLLRRAFYIKTSERLSAPVDARAPTWRRSLIEDLSRDWGWTSDEIQRLDARHAWRIDTAVEERRDLIKTLQKSYAVLSDFARRHGQDQKITGSDLNILGRKLYAAFDKKPHKLELVTRGICQNPAEPYLTLHRLTLASGIHWAVFDGNADVNITDSRAPLKRGESLVEILTWCHFNRLIDTHTVWGLLNDGRRQGLGELRKILDALNESFATQRLPATPATALTRKAVATQALFFINIDCDIAPAKLAEGDVLTSVYTDAFRFGGRRSSLIGAVDVVLCTSWEELYCYRYTGPDALPRALTEYLAQATDDYPLTPEVYCFTPDYHHSIRQRVTQYLRAIYTTFGNPTQRGRVHHIVAVADGFHELARSDAGPRFRLHASPLTLITALAESEATFRRVIFDDSCHGLPALACSYRHNKQGSVQVFAYHHNTKMDFYVLDEQGDLFFERSIEPNLLAYFDHLERFFMGLQQHLSVDGDLQPRAGTPIECYRLLPDQAGTLKAIPVARPSARGNAYLALRVVADLNADAQPDFTCYCDEREFSSQTHGAALFTALAVHILAGRQNRERYPVYITELEISERFRALRGPDACRTAKLLELKKRIEYQLTKALRRDL